MPKVIKIPEKLIGGHSRKELRLVIGMIVRAINIKLRVSHIVNFKVPKLGRFHTHGNKVKRGYKKGLSADRKRKRIKLLEKEFQKDNLLW